MGNTTGLKQQNMLDIIREIKKQGEITKPSIARVTGLTTVTVHNFVNELVQNGICMESGSAGSNGGRKATLYKINDQFGYIPGVILERKAIVTTIHDLGLNPVYYSEIPCTPDNSVRVLALIAEEVERAISAAGISKGKCFGLGIAVPGKVNRSTGVIINLPDIPNWDGVPIKKAIEGMVGIKVCADNDSNARAISAKWQGAFGDDVTAVLLNITVGVGTGVLSSGSILYGSHSYAGEIGHTTIDYRGPLCSCGNRGCIEALTTDQAIIERVTRLHDINTPGNNNEGKEMDIKDVISLAKDKGNSAVYEILRETAYYISIALDHVVKIYDPATIIIQNNWLQEFPDLYYYIIENLFTRCPWVKKDGLKITLDSVDRFVKSSAACLVQENLLTNLEDNILLKLLEVKAEP